MAPHPRHQFVLAFTSLVILVGLATSYQVRTAAQGEAPWPEIMLTPVVGGLSSPVHVTHAGDGSGRLFLVEQGGKIRIYKNNLMASPFLDIRGRVRSPDSGGGNEEGLLSVAFPPGFGSQKHHFYVYYTNNAGDNQVSRFFLSADPDRADPTLEQVVILFQHPSQTNHNGGQLAFGPDGYLYISTGDGGGGGDPYKNAQDPGSLLGKILRIDVENDAAPVVPGPHSLYLPLIQDSDGTAFFTYQIPADNPFVNTPGYLPEIWALGLRNPWRFSFDRQTGDLYIGDVGQNKWEEVDFQPAGTGGANYGWNILEGPDCYAAATCNSAGMTLPVFAYSHNLGSCSITGGFVYRGVDHPQMQSIYFFTDFCTGTMWGLQRDSGSWISSLLTVSGGTADNFTSFGEDEAGELYLVSRSNQLYKIEAVAP